MKRYTHHVFKIGRWLLVSICVSLLVINLLGIDIKAAVGAEPPETVTFYGSDTSPISSAVAVPADQAYYWTSGTVPPVINPDAPPRTRDRYGDTKTQAIGILE